MACLNEYREVAFLSGVSKSFHRSVVAMKHQIKCHIMTLCFYILIYLKVLLTAMMQDKIKSKVLLQ